MNTGSFYELCIGLSSLPDALGMQACTSPNQKTQDLSHNVHTACSADSSMAKDIEAFIPLLYSAYKVILTIRDNLIFLRDYPKHIVAYRISQSCSLCRTHILIYRT